MSKIKTNILLCMGILIIFFISFIVHEFGHIIIGLFLGYELIEVNIGVVNGLLAFYVNFNNNTNFWMKFAGGVFQAMFLLPFSKKIPELRIAVVAFIMYGLWEAFIY